MGDNLRVHIYSFIPESETLKISGKKEKIPNPFLLFFKDWKDNNNAPKKMTEASKEASLVWGSMSAEEKDHWRKSYEKIRDKDEIHDIYHDGDDDTDQNVVVSSDENTNQNVVSANGNAPERQHPAIKQDVFMGCKEPTS